MTIGKEELSLLPSDLDWRQIRVAAWCLRVLSSTSWVDRNRASINTDNNSEGPTRNLRANSHHSKSHQSLSTTLNLNAGNGKHGSGSARRRSSAGSIAASSFVLQGEMEGCKSNDDRAEGPFGTKGPLHEQMSHDRRVPPYNQYDGDDTQTISLAQDFAVLVLERSAKVVLTLLHEYHSIEATVHANNQGSVKGASQTSSDRPSWKCALTALEHARR